jgi:hypothetical protein
MGLQQRGPWLDQFEVKKLGVWTTSSAILEALWTGQYIDLLVDHTWALEDMFPS